MNSSLKHVIRVLTTQVVPQKSFRPMCRISVAFTTRPVYHCQRIPSLYISTRSIQMPQFHKPPNKHELLNQARGFFQRLKVRIKYPLMKQMRPFNLNDISALVSWIFLGHTVWLVLGTTSFISFGLWAANSLQFQGSIYPLY